jgi:hypothetical protein
MSEPKAFLRKNDNNERLIQISSAKKAKMSIFDAFNRHLV